MKDGRTVRRLAQWYRREYLSVFGSFELYRAVYGSPEGQKIKQVPLDERMQLPPGSHPTCCRTGKQGLVVEMAHTTVSATIERILGLRQSVHTLEHAQHGMATVCEDFWEARPTPPAEQEGALLMQTM